MELDWGREFTRQYKKLDCRIRDQVTKRLDVFASDAFHPLLHNHKLHWPYEGFSSINITGDIRLIYKKIGPDRYFLHAIGTHHQLFGS